MFIAQSELSIGMSLTWDGASSLLVQAGAEPSRATSLAPCAGDPEPLAAGQALPAGLAFGRHAQLLLGNNSVYIKHVVTGISTSRGHVAPLRPDGRSGLGSGR